jgi:uncharacterized membrane protein YeaQ/YmgE (transglycosylase-associated protein family)
MGLVIFTLFGSVIGLITYAMLPLARRRKVGRFSTVAGSIAGSFEGGLLMCLLTNQPFTDVDILASLASIAGAIAMPRLLERISAEPAAQPDPIDKAPPSSPWPRQRRRVASSAPPSSGSVSSSRFGPSSSNRFNVGPPSSSRFNVGPPSSKPNSSRRTGKARKSNRVARMLGRLFKG